MKKKLILGMTVLFMIIAVIFIACPSSDSGGSSADADDADGTEEENPDAPVIKPSIPNPNATLEGDNLELTVNVTGDDTGYTYKWYYSESDSYNGKLIEGAAGKTFNPPTTDDNIYGIKVVGRTIWYYAEVFIPGEEPLLSKRQPVTVKANPFVAAKLPDITKQPEGATYAKDADLVDSLTVTAEVTSENPEAVGELTYQWWVTADIDSEGEPYGDLSEPKPKDSATSAAVEASCVPDVSKIGVFYYYLVVTNTIEDNGDGGTDKSRSVNSEIAKIEVKRAVSAQKPVIKSITGGDKLYSLNQSDVTSIVVTVNAVPEGVLTYKWYRRSINSNEEGEAVAGASASGTIPIAGGTASFRPPVNIDKSLWYYFCEVTNAINTAPADAVIVGEPQSVRSSPVYIGVGITPITLSGLSVQTKTFDGSRDAVITGTPVLSLTVPGLTLQRGSGQFADANAGSNKPVELIGWYLVGTNGTNASEYKLEIPNNLRGQINRAAGADVETGPDVGTGLSKVIIKSKNITLMEEVVLATTATDLQMEEQVVEYGVSLVGTGANITWKGASLTITGLNANTGYFIYARSMQSTNFYAGTTVKKMISNGDFPVTTASGAAISGNVTATNITDKSVTAVAVNVTPVNGQTVEYAIDTASNTAAASLRWQDTLVFTGLDGETDYYVYARAKENSDYHAGAYKVSSAAARTLSPLITFDTGGGTMVSSRNISKGVKLANDSSIVTTRSGYKFEAWFTDTAKTIPYDFDNVVNGSFTLYAGWILNSQVNAMAQKNMVRVPSGWFTMGSPANESGREPLYGGKETQHRVGLDGFWMGKYEVTQEEWQAVMGSNPSYFDGTGTASASNAYEGKDKSTPQGEVQGKRPVEKVNWYAAIAYCNRLSISENLTPAYKINGTTYPPDWGNIPSSNNGTWNAVEIVAGSTGYRLPTEAQWEYACRAGTTTAYSTGASITTNTGWYNTGGNTFKDGNSQIPNPSTAGLANGKTHQVGLKPSPANAWGLYDMHGNVAEWCWDWYQADLGTATVTNPTGPTMANSTTPTSNSAKNIVSGAKQRVFRGGSWGGNLLGLNNDGGTSAALISGVGGGTSRNWHMVETAPYLRSAARSGTVYLKVTQTNGESYTVVYPFNACNFVGLRLVRP